VVNKGYLTRAVRHYNCEPKQVHKLLMGKFSAFQLNRCHITNLESPPQRPECHSPLAEDSDAWMGKCVLIRTMKAAGWGPEACSALL